jgi:nitrite reductase/ring-hydroxylating ferredoxin subunit
MIGELSRRAFLKLTGVVGGAFLFVSCKISDFIRGASQTGLPQIEDSWTYKEVVLMLDLAKLPELGDLGGAVRIQGDVLSGPILIVLGEDDNYYAFQNSCTHIGRMIDPATGTMTLRCSSIICKHPSTYDYQGNVLSGLAEGPLTSYQVSREGEQLIITL